MRVGGTAIRCDSNETVCSALLAQATEAREKGWEWERQEVAKETVLEIGGGGESGHWEKVKMESIMGRWLFLAFEME